MKIAVWNIRGIGSSSKKRIIRSLIREEGIDIIGLVESKHNEVTLHDMNRCWGNQDVEWLQVPAGEGGSGGMILSWIKDIFILEEHKTTQYWILALGILQQNNFRCNICTVYAPNDQTGRLDVWNQLREMKANSPDPWILMGDFNEVLCPQERRGASTTTPGMREMAHFIQDLQMIDMDINLKFTWMRRNAASRIDRILVGAEFMDSFPRLQAYCKDRLLSDHYPILLAFNAVSWGPQPFRSLDCWLKEPSFLQVFKKEWLQLTRIPLDQKLKKLKHH